MKPTSKNLEELEYLYQRISLILDYMMEKTPHKSFVKELIDILNAAYKRKHLSGLRIMSRDMAAMSKALSKTEQIELQIILDKEMNEENFKSFDDSRTIKIINLVISNNSIENKEEYEIIDDYLKDMSEVDMFFQHQELFHHLLLKFENYFK